MIHLVDCCVALQLLLPLVIYATDHTGVQKLLKIDPVTLRGNALDYEKGWTGELCSKNHRKTNYFSWHNNVNLLDFLNKMFFF